ncbi:MAG TPA: hypothetical protein DGG95_12870 [Cytophagales bacterium]|nr:hypothetical protein [Cytophagales bacterium]
MAALLKFIKENIKLKRYFMVGTRNSLIIVCFKNDFCHKKRLAKINNLVLINKLNLFSSFDNSKILG